ncbi:mRNA 3'-end-processing protein RNA14 [Mycena venus]|uniref:mRNA 3'-end-processing protein RNA14 n=1 Tax=Mycena venus TaxID=2733690 RepID=A0A8H6WYL1_9AGAR|nr:mRNA 3'-end-processing protein RNA14 [Mycena venus]
MSETLPDSNVQTEAGTDAAPPVSDYDALMARLKESPHDPESWKRLIDVAETGGDILQIREAYDALLKQYPNTASAQTAYIKHFLDNPSSFAPNEAEELLNKFLKPSPSVELWKFYLDYVRRMNVGTGNRETVRKAFDFALNHIGQDRDSGSIWAEYIQFLNSAETSNTWEAQQKMDALRKVYHRAVQTPLDNVEQLWTQFEAFEMGLNKITAKKYMSDLSPAHMQARTVLRQLTIHLQGLGGTNTSGIFLPALPTFSSQERQLIGRWKAYLKWEEGNPLEIEDKDRSIFTSRVEKVYRKAVIRMRYYPEIWFMAYSWTVSIGKNDDAMALLKAGLEANPESFALTYAYAEMLERAELKKDQRDFSEVHSLYERFFGVLRVKLARLTEAAAPSKPAADDAPVDEANKDENKEDNNTTVEAVPATAAPPGLYSNAWINYMRFARRAQGHKAGRDAFAKARKDGFTGWEVYEAAAMTEYRCNLEDGRMVATRIFETGMKKFGTDVHFVLAHLSFLLTINDENNARALFERVAGTFPPQEAKPIWERWSRSQYQYDDLEAVLELERRMAEVYPNDAPIKRFAQRHTYHSIDAIADNDLGFAKTRKLSAVNTGTFNQSPSVPPPNGVNPLVAANANANGVTNPNTNKRPLPPTDRKQTDYKRPRPDERDRDRRRYTPPPQSPAWERDRDVKPPLRRDPPPREKDEKPAGLPTVLNWFVTQLPPREAFDGPVFNTDNLMDTLKNAVIPSSSNRARSPPPPPRPVGRPPPDYGPYQGPQSGPPRGVGRRY